MATLYLKTAGGNWTDAATWSNVNAGGGDSSGPPTAADDCIAELLSGNVTISATSVCRSFDTTSGTGSWGGTLTHNSSTSWNVGDGTAGAGNVALKFNSGITYTRGSTTSSRINFVSTNATQQSITWAGKTTGNVTFDGLGGSWIYVDAHVFASNTSGVLTVTQGTLDSGNQTIDAGSLVSTGTITRAITLGTSAVTLGLASGSAWSVTSTGLTLSAASSTITLNGSSATFVGAGLTYGTVVMSGAGTAAFTGSGTTFATFTRTGTAVKGDTLSLSSPFTVTGTLNLNGNSSINRLILQSSVLGSSRTITITGATINASNVDFQDITFTTGTTDLSAITGGSGDCGGNSGITFTTAATKYWVGGTGNWDDPTNHWATSTGGAPGATNLPLPQDDVVFDANSFTAISRTVTSNQPRLGKNIDWSAATNSPTWSIVTSLTLHGSLTLISSMTLSLAGQTFTFNGRGSSTLTSASKNFGPVTVTMFGGTLTLSDAFSCSGHTTTITNGTVNFGAFTHTIFALSSAGSAARTLNLNSSTILLGNGTGASTVWNLGGTNLTFAAGTSTLKLSSTDSNTKTFTGAGLTYNNLVFTGTGTGVRQIANGNVFAAVSNDNSGTAFTIRFPAGGTNTVTSFALVGTAANVITLDSSSAGSAATLSDTTGTNTAYYCSIKDSTASGGATWNAYNSTNVSGNTGWNFLSLGPSRGTLALLGCGT